MIWLARRQREERLGVAETSKGRAAEIDLSAKRREYSQSTRCARLRLSLPDARRLIQDGIPQQIDDPVASKRSRPSRLCISLGCI